MSKKVWTEPAAEPAPEQEPGRRVSYAEARKFLAEKDTHTISIRGFSDEDVDYFLDGGVEALDELFTIPEEYELEDMEQYAFFIVELDAAEPAAVAESSAIEANKRVYAVAALDLLVDVALLSPLVLLARAVVLPALVARLLHAPLAAAERALAYERAARVGKLARPLAAVRAVVKLKTRAVSARARVAARRNRDGGVEITECGDPAGCDALDGDGDLGELESAYAMTEDPT